MTHPIVEVVGCAENAIEFSYHITVSHKSNIDKVFWYSIGGAHGWL